MEAELKRALQFKGTLYSGVEPEVLSDLAAAAQRHGLTTAKEAAAAFDKWMTVHRIDNKSVDAVDVAAFGREYVGKGRMQPLAAARSHNLFNRVSLDDMVLPDVGEAADIDAGASASAAQPSQRITPYLSKVAARPGTTPKAHTPATGGKFAERQNAGSVVAALNAHLEVPAAAEAEEGDAMEVDGGAAAAARGGVEVEVLGAPLAPGAKYMVDRLEDRVAYLESRILAAEAAAGGEVHPTGAAAQQPALFVGRVVCDSEGGHLNPQSLLLEGSQRSSNGARVRLDVSKCPGYRLFPGQVVALRGTNPSGHCIVASQVLPGHALPLPTTDLAALAGYAAATGRRGTSLVVAAGPFTSAEDLEYAPLGALLDFCSQPEHRPDVLLLLGPFVDAEHPAVRGGLLEESFEDVYASRVLGQVARFRSQVGGRTRVLLMPSTRDVHHHPVLPQPPLEAAGGAMALANPATLRCNEVVLGATSADWLMGCNREEVSRAAPGQQEERLPALAAHLPAQRCYYPLFPPPAGVPLDCSRSTAALQMPCTPDLLLTPSDLAPFAKLCPVHMLPKEAATPGGEAAGEPAAAPAPGGNAVCVNPGRLAKGASGGTFAHIRILPLPEALDVAGGAPAPTNAPVAHQLERRCRVEIKRV